jgi:hypothetical protein
MIHEIIRDQKWVSNLDPKEKFSKIINRVRRVLGKALGDWYTSVKTHKEESNMEDMKEANKLKSWQAQKRDMFDWLKVPSRFTLLKKMVRETLVEIIGERRHREQIEKALDDYLQIKQKNSDAQLVNSKIDLNEIEQARLAAQKKSEPLIFSTSAANKRNFSIQSFQEHLQKGLPKTFQGSMAIGQNHQFPKDFTWTDIKEDKYNQAREKAQHLLYPMVKSSKFGENGLSQFVQSVNRKDNHMMATENDTDQDGNDSESGWGESIEGSTKKKANSLRDELLDRYMNGNWMTEQEIKYICMTSITLNYYLDRKFHQNAVNILDPEFIEGIEMNIAEHIIFNYYDIRNKIKKHRDNFLKRKADDMHKKIYHMVPQQSRDFPVPYSYKHSDKALAELEINKKYLELQKSVVQHILLEVDRRTLQREADTNDGGYGHDPNQIPDVHVPNEYQESQWIRKARNPKPQPQILKT